MSTDRLEKWGEGKRVGFVMLAREIAGHAEEAGRFVNWILSGEILRILPPPPPAWEMLRMYRNHRKVLGIVGLISFKEEGVDAEFMRAVEQLLDEHRRLRRMPEDQRRETITKMAEELIADEEARKIFPEVAKLIVEAYRAQAEELRKVWRGTSDGGLRDKDIRVPEMQFYLRVWLPCLVAYGDYAPRVLRRARGGDQTALHKMLRLDKSIIGDRLIADQLFQAHARGTRGAFAKLGCSVKAYGKKLKKRQLKVQLASLISMLAKSMKVDITTRDIQELFDAVAAARKTRTLIDEDLPEPETFAREVRLMRAVWAIFDEGGRKSQQKPSG